MISLWKNPSIPVANRSKIKREIHGLLRPCCLYLEREALRKPGALRAQPPYLAAGSIGANQKARSMTFPRRKQMNVVAGTHNLSYGRDPLEAGADCNRLAQAIFIELGPHSHHADGFAAFQHRGRRRGSGF